MNSNFYHQSEPMNLKKNYIWRYLIKLLKITSDLENKKIMIGFLVTIANKSVYGLMLSSPT